MRDDEAPGGYGEDAIDPGSFVLSAMRSGLVTTGAPAPCSKCGGSRLSDPAGEDDPSLAGLVDGPCLECLGLGFVST